MGPRGITFFAVPQGQSRFLTDASFISVKTNPNETNLFRVAQCVKIYLIIYEVAKFVAIYQHF